MPRNAVPSLAHTAEGPRDEYPINSQLSNGYKQLIGEGEKAGWTRVSVRVTEIISMHLVEGVKAEERRE